ncbi:MAG: long-subunit fatty acid transport protein [Gammaproteobacteria bacterium]|jgi:long-subunit fatty acid transport protein
MNSKKITHYFSVVIFILWSTWVGADTFHYNNILIGDRATGMGGAYTAISDDASGMFYNPAGIVFSEDKKLSASVNAFHSTKTTYDGVLGGGDWSRESSDLLPNFFGLTRKLGDHYFGFSYAVTDSVVENQDSNFVLPGIPQFTVNVNNRDTTLVVGPSWAKALSDTLNIGVTLYLHQRDRELISNQWATFSDTSTQWQNIYTENEETGFNTIIGLMWSPTIEYSFGLSLSQTSISSSSNQIQSTCVSEENSVAIQGTLCPSVAPTITKTSAKRSLPTNLRLGFAYFPSDKLLLDVDVSFHQTSKDDFADRKATTNLAVGIEYYMAQNWALRGGLFTNRSNSASIKSGQTNQDEHIDLNGVSVSMTRFSKESSFSFGISTMSGSGEAQVIANNPEIQDVDHSATTFYISSSHSI